MRINHLKAIARYWDAEAKAYCESHPEHYDPSMHPSWGFWHIPEATLGLLAGELEPGRSLVDLGCGPGHDATGYAQRGLNVLAVDVSKEQLARAVPHPRVTYRLAAGERLPVPDGSLDIAVSDHGAFDHSPAPLLLAELRRALKPRAPLVVCTYSPLAYACYDRESRKIGPRLLNGYPSNDVRFDGKLVTSELSYGQWIKSFRQSGFSVERLEELMPEPGARCYFDELVGTAWGARWPLEIAWVVRRDG